MKIDAVEGIGPAYADRLRRAGVVTTDALLKRAASAKGRQELADESGVDRASLLAWVNRADLMRVRGLGEEYTDLLEAAGVDSPRELAQRKPENLAAKLRDVNSESRLVRQVPGERTVTKWIEYAKTLPTMVEH